MKGLNVVLDDQNRDYRGKRALMLLRVSTPEQEKGFGWPAQEREIRRKLLEPLGLKLDEQRHIIRDAYTGLEFRERPTLDQILEMARRHEFDILITDVLDRIGRKGLARELYRMQLRELGVRILTTDPDDHADDDSLIGEMVRLLKGYQAEEELNNIRRRTMNGKRVKGIEPSIAKDPTADRRKNINKMLTDIRKRQNVFREQLANLIMGNKLDKGTEEFLTAQLQQLADQEDDCQRELARDEDGIFWNYGYSLEKRTQPEIMSLIS